MRALVLAGGLPQIELIKQLKDRDIFAILVDGSDKAIAIPYADKFYHENIFDLEKVKSIAIEEDVDFIITVCADQVLLVSAMLSEELNLPSYIDYKTAQMVSDKVIMKEYFSKYNIPTTKYYCLDELDISKVSKLKLPLVVKPTDAYSSKGVRKVENNEELIEFFNQAKEISRSGQVIVEEFYDGIELSVDLHVKDGKAIVLCITNSQKIKDNDKFIISRGMYPAEVNVKIVDQVKEACQKIADAFELKNTPMLVQFLTNGETISVIEFSARTGGAMKYLLIKKITGVDVIKDMIDLTLEKDIEIKIKEPIANYIVNDFIYCRQGVFDHLEGFEELLQDGVIYNYHLLKSKGTMIDNPSSSSNRVCGVEINANSKEEYNTKLAQFKNRARVIDNEGKDMMRRDLLTNI